MDQCVGVGRWRFLKLQTASRCFIHDPDQRNVGKRIVRITAADIRMDAREPNLTQFFVGKIAVAIGPRFWQGTALARSRERDGMLSAHRPMPVSGMRV